MVMLKNEYCHHTMTGPSKTLLPFNYKKKQKNKCPTAAGSSLGMPTRPAPQTLLHPQPPPHDADVGLSWGGEGVLLLVKLEGVRAQ